ncbi:MAG TPA: DCC1-like thiol-disulfide oxidoreductase family protein [Candidatus Thermoplasmatota archaeon]|nr:DCC1-like thiol-disulfide oxidoreductase family protein [Candidatus Thermoplasmatota archaeon]
MAWDERPHPLAVLRIGFAVTWAWSLAMLGNLVWSVNAIDGLPWHPVGPALLLGGPPSTTALVVLWGAGMLGTVLLGLGLFTRVAGWVALACGTLLAATLNSLGKLDHGSNLPLVFLAVFSFSDWGDVGGLDARRGHPRPGPDARGPILAFLAIASLMYASAAVIKVARGEFLASGSMEAFLRTSGTGPAAGLEGLGTYLLGHRWATDAMAWGSLAVELGVAAALLARSLRLAVSGTLAMFHAGIALLTGISFRANALLWLVVGAATLAGGLPRGPPLTLRPMLRRAAGAGAFGVVAVLTARGIRGSAGLPLAEGAGWAASWLAVAPVWPLVFTAGVILFLAGLVAALRAIAAGAAPPRPDAHSRWLLYDGGCGFCKRWCDWAARRTVDVQYVPCQEAQAIRLQAGIGEAACLEAAFFVETTAQGVARVEKGAGAIHAVLGRFAGRRRVLWRMLALTYRLEGVRQAQDVGYGLVARNRHRITEEACAMPLPTHPKP